MTSKNKTETGAKEERFPHSDVEIGSDRWRENLGETPNAATLDDLLDDLEDNIEERETLQKDSSNLLPENSVRTLQNKENNRLFKARTSIADITGLNSLNPKELGKGESTLLSQDYSNEIDDLIRNSQAVEIGEIEGTDYLLEDGLNAATNYNYLDALSEDIFHNIAWQQTDDRTFYEVDVMVQWDVPIDLEGDDKIHTLQLLSTWRFRGLIDDQDAMSFAEDAYSNVERNKAREYFDEETYQLFEDAGLLGDKELGAERLFGDDQQEYYVEVKRKDIGENEASVNSGVIIGESERDVAGKIAKRRLKKKKKGGRKR